MADRDAADVQVSRSMTPEQYNHLISAIAMIGTFQIIITVFCAIWIVGEIEKSRDKKETP